MYPALVALMGGEIAVFLFFLVWFNKWTSTALKIVTTVIFLVGMAAIATNKETPIEAGRMWFSVAAALAAGLINGIVGASNSNIVK